MKNYIFILKKYLLLNNKLQLAIVLVLTLVQCIVVLCIPSVNLFLIDYGIIKNNKELVLILALVMFFLYASNSLITILNNYFMAVIGEKIGYEMRRELNEKICKLEYSFFIRNASADLIGNFNKEIEVIKNNISYKLLRVFSNAVSLISASFMIIYLDSKAAIIISAVCVIYIIFVRNWGKVVSRLSELSFKYNKCVLNILINTYRNVFAIKINNAFSYINKRFDDEYERLYSNEVKLETAYATNINIGTLIMNFATVLLWGIGGIQAALGVISIGKLTAIIGYQNMLVNPINFMCDFLNSFHNTVKAIANYNLILNSKEDVVNKSGKYLGERIHSIKLNNIYFSYDKIPLLNGISYSFEVGKIYGIIGKSGSGKSTLAKILVRLLIPERGEVYINNINYKELELFSYRNEIGYVMQDSYIFHDTIINNLTFGSEKDLFHDAKYKKILQLLDEIDQMPKQWNTVLSETGQNISGGQQKRLEIMRNLIKDASVLIFDEAFNGIDYNRKKEILQLLEELKKNHIIIIITHDDLELESCDIIYNINDK